MFAPPTAIYTHGPALIMLCIFLKEILLLREFAKKQTQHQYATSTLTKEFHLLFSYIKHFKNDDINI
jgi:hypothetical protein